MRGGEKSLVLVQKYGGFRRLGAKVATYEFDGTRVARYNYGQFQSFKIV